MARKPAVAGSFYPLSSDSLTRQIEESFKSGLGPGKLPASRTGTMIRGIISPHAGYVFSGSCAAWGYSEIAKTGMPDFYLLLGPNHRGDSSTISLEDWDTPLGVVRNAREVSEQISEATGIPIDRGEQAAEHSIEVQLPLLQYASRDRVQDLRIVPIMLGFGLDHSAFAARLHSALKGLGKTYVTIVSSDFTHYGASYHYLPFTSDVPKRLGDLDKGAIDLIVSNDTKGFVKYISGTGITICGFMPILVFMSMLSVEEYGKGGKLLKYYTSGDVLGDYHNSVSYACILFR